MASVDNISVFESEHPYEEIVRAQLTATGASTYVSRQFGRLHSVSIAVESTNTTTFSWTTKTVTITGTNDDWVQIRIIGYH